MFLTLPNGIKVFYRTAGPADGNVVLLLHGFPSSSNQFRNLIPILASQGYRVVAPDLPGFGFTEIPAELKFEYTFENIATTTMSFLDELGISKFAVYVFDYGAPTGFRIALRRPEAIAAIFSQNGNAYVEGLQSFWDPLRQYWAAAPGSPEEAQVREELKNGILTYNITEFQYTHGEPHPETIDPASWNLDWALMNRPGNMDIQLDLFKSYGTNVALYPQFQEYLRETQVPLLAVWGKNDVIFPPPGAEAFKKDLPNAEIELWDGGHFLEESHTEAIGKRMLQFFRAIGF